MADRHEACKDAYKKIIDLSSNLTARTDVKDHVTPCVGYRTDLIVEASPLTFRKGHFVKNGATVARHSLQI